MTRRTGPLLRRAAVLATLGFLGLGAAATVLTLAGAGRQRDRELARSTRDADELVTRVYRYREANGRYPRDLNELRPITGERPPKGRTGPPDNDQFCAGWCWTYHWRGETTPPILFREAGDHTRLVYEFAPSSGYYYPPGVDQGWVVGQEGTYRYLRSIPGVKSTAPPPPSP